MSPLSPLKLVVLLTLATRLEALPPSSPDFLKTVKEALQPILDAAGQYYQVQIIFFKIHSLYNLIFTLQ